MADDLFDVFLRDATAFDPSLGTTIEPDPLFGLYTSWCSITCQQPCTEASFWEAMRQRFRSGPNGLRMKGPAAADYFLNSYPALV